VLENVVIPTADTDLVTLKCGGQNGGYPLRQCVDRVTAEKAATTFALTGKADPTLTWEDAWQA
jgi:hypothetical protein